MAVFKRPGSSLFQYEFELAGKRYRGTTGETDKSAALLFEATVRQQAKEAAKNPGTKFWTLRQTATAWLKEGEVERRDYLNDYSRVRKLFGLALVDGEDVPSGRHGLPESLMVHEFRQDHVADLVAARRSELVRGKLNSPATINRELALLQALFEFARRSGVKLPDSRIEWRDYRGREPKGKLRYLSEDEERALLDLTVAGMKQYKDQTGPQATMIQDQFDLVVFLLDTGARYDEVASLTWECVNLEERTVSLYRAKVDNEGTLGMTRRLHALLVSRRAAAPDSRYIFPAWDRGKVVNDRPRGWSTHGIQKRMDSLGFNDPATVKRKGKATAHTFRDTFAARQIKAGATLYELQHLLGHSSPDMTQKYAHIYDDFGRKGASRLDALHELAEKRQEGDDPKPLAGVYEKRQEGDDPKPVPTFSPAVAVPALAG